MKTQYTLIKISYRHFLMALVIAYIILGFSIMASAQTIL